MQRMFPKTREAIDNLSESPKLIQQYMRTAVAILAAILAFCVGTFLLVARNA